MSDPAIQTTAEGVELQVFVQPRASRSRVVGRHDTMIKIQLAAPPVDGKANRALIAFLAKELGLAKADVLLRAGEQGRRKRLLLRGASAESVRRALLDDG